MTRKMARSTPSTTVWDARGADSRLPPASGLQEGGKSEIFTPNWESSGEFRVHRRGDEAGTLVTGGLSFRLSLARC